MEAEELRRKMTAARLVLAIVSTLAVEVALYTVWRWVLPEWGVEISLAGIIAVMVGWAVFAGVEFWLVTRVLKKQAMVGLPTMIGTRGKAVSALNPEGQVRIKGELWGAEAIDRHVNQGENILVVGQDGLKLLVRWPGDGQKSGKSGTTR